MGKFKVEKVADHSNGGFTETLEYKVLNQSNVKSNRNKWYAIEIQKHPDGRLRLFTHYGRVGSSNVFEVRQLCEGQPVTNFDLVKKEFESIIKKKLRGKSVPDPDNPGQKMREAYEEIEVVAPSVGSENIRGKSEKKTVTVKKASIDTKHADPRISKLLDQLVDENVHNITSMTTLKYTANGFETPLGPVTKEHVDRARQPLLDLNKIMGKKGELDPEREDVKQLHNLFFSLVPHKFGRQITVDDMITDANQLQAEFDMLDQLATAVQMGNAMQQNTQSRINALGSDIEFLTDETEVKRIKRYIRGSKASNHRGSNVWYYDVKTIYKIKIPDERSRYDNAVGKYGNVKEVMHGSASSNCLSILKGGLHIPSVNAGHVTGRLNGAAIYGAIQSTKALNYSIGFWGGKKSKYNNAFLFLIDFAMGKTFETTSSTPNGAPRGYDSVWAKPGYLYNHELMVYKLEQATIKYIVEMVSTR